jgi:oxygen-independent coproporphyrinogen-3 oxidase
MLESSTPLSLYLHIPFCGTRCTHCAFNTYTTMEAHIPAYVAAMCNELRWLGTVTTDPVHTVFFGGGTPSLLDAGQVRAILDTLHVAFTMLPGCEITFEVNPGSSDASYFAALGEAGVNRLSIGMQSAHVGELMLFQRDHTVDAVPAAVRAVREAGFTRLSLDLIYGIPNQSLAMWETSVRAALALDPDHLSMYALQLETGTPLHKQVERGLLARPDDDLAADMYELADEMVTAAGLPQYEISNWARPAQECVHNLQYWRNLPYLGVGAGAHGYAGGLRYECARAIPRYITVASSQGEPCTYPLTPAVERYHIVERDDEMAEHMMTGLRLTREGVSASGFAQRFGVSIFDVYAAQIERFEFCGLLCRDGDRIRLTPRARLLSNQVFAEFMR